MTQRNPLDSLTPCELLDLGICEVIAAWPLALGLFVALSAEIGNSILVLERLTTDDEPAKVSELQRLMALHALLDRSFRVSRCFEAVPLRAH